MPSNKELGNGNSTWQQRATMHDNEESRSGSNTQQPWKKKSPIKNRKKKNKSNHNQTNENIILTKH